ncbi:hypothetical protein [Paludisphaera mucosa]|uniref:Uncharacterized protein n=1 Tax=Paludisphaera mucosa TaxID=3030827 RepID=A0ABT6F837_9BACT|nr:hypothetical protein [Paludisphaera mucosa]MDG3003589.1 hypothetical protein [Paludisphaera mucosa]
MLRKKFGRGGTAGFVAEPDGLLAASLVGGRPRRVGWTLVDV